MEIFCDESGFTGNHLLDSQQEVFTYASVCVDSAEAESLVLEIKQKYRLAGNELKGSSLIKQANGKRAVTEILTRLEGKFLYASHLKPYALAAKFFEYIFEPPISDCNSVFYEINFHRFISTLLFTYFRSSNADSEKLLEDFSQFARRGDITRLSAIFPANKIVSYQNDPLQAIGLFAQIHQKVISEEVIGPREPGVPNWLLDLTTTSLYGLLVSWGQIHGSLEVTCDEAKPLKGDLPIFDVMVGRRDQAYVRFQRKERPMLFNLSRPLLFAKSHLVAGIQLADVVAAAAGFVWKSMYDNKPSGQSRRWKELIFNSTHEDSIWPDLSDFDPNNPEAFANTIILMELVERSVKDKDLCQGIYEMHQLAKKLHPDFKKRNGR